MEEKASFIVLSRTESTNDYAMDLIRQGRASVGLALFTADQTAGKGQRGKVWEGEPGKNLAVSIILSPGQEFKLDKFFFNAHLTISCLRFLQNLVPIGLTIKWPNDIYRQDKKLAGILIENVIRGKSWDWAVAGIGINVNQTDFSKLNGRAVSLSSITGITYDPEKLSKSLHQFVLASFMEKLNEAELMRNFNDCLYKRGEKVLLQAGEDVLEAVILGVNEFGQLQVLDDSENIRTFNVGEVVWK
jgi:BirA family biotin operon repressor/biotin-[acetyl-CoA-carboxylase] ligase